MAVPTFTSVTPAIGHPGGAEAVLIEGANFRVRTLAPYPIPSISGDTVRVTVGGRVARASVLSATQVRIQLPPYLGSPTEMVAATRAFPPVDIVISNLDDNGAVIAGETVVAADAFTYVVPALRLPDVDPQQGPLCKVVEGYLALLRRTVVPEAWWQMHTDYADAGGTASKISTHPAASILLEILKDPEYGYHDNSDIEDDQGDGTYNVYAASTTCMAVFDTTLSCEHRSEGLMLMGHLMTLTRRNPWLIVAAEPRLVSATENYYPLELVMPPKQISGPTGANVFAAQARLRVRGIPLVPTGAIGKVYQISAINLISSDLASTSPSIITL